VLHCPPISLLDLIILIILGEEYKSRSRGQTTRDGPPAWELGVGLTTLHHKNKLVTKNLTPTITLPKSSYRPFYSLKLRTNWWNCSHSFLTQVM
jgi:hypothetical protein